MLKEHVFVELDMKSSRPTRSCREPNVYLCFQFHSHTSTLYTPCLLPPVAFFSWYPIFFPVFFLEFSGSTRKYLFICLLGAIVYRLNTPEHVYIRTYAVVVVIG